MKNNLFSWRCWLFAALLGFVGWSPVQAIPWSPEVLQNNGSSQLQMANENAWANTQSIFTADWGFETAPTGVMAGTVTIGTGISTQRYPLGNYFGYERSASIYTAAEIADNGMISSFGWYADTAGQGARPIVIYVKETASSTFASSSTWATLTSGATQVYSGSITPVAGWNTITLPTPYLYTSDNLMVLVEANAGGGGSTGISGNSIRYSSVSNGHQYWYADTNPPTGSGTLSSSRPNIQMNFEANEPCDGTPNGGTASVSIAAGGVGATYTVSASGYSMGSGLLYQWFNSEDGISWNAVTAQTETYSSYSASATVPGETTYWRLNVFCENSFEEADSVPASFTTNDEITYYGGNLPSGFGAPTNTTVGCSEGNILTVSVPAGKRIASLQVQYSMTSTGGGWMSEQRSYIYSPTLGLGESSIASGTGSNAGVFNYSRALAFAQYATGDIDFVIRAFRTYGGSGCGDTFAYVNNGSWKLTPVFEDLPACPEPTVTQTVGFTDATFDWSGFNSDFYVVAGGSAAPDETTIPTYEGVSSPYTVSGLSMNTAYDVYIRANCGSEVSPWIKKSFTTQYRQGVVWTEGFATATLPLGWTNTNGSISNTLTAITNGGADTYFIYRNLYSGVLSHNVTTVYVGELGADDEFSFQYKAANWSSPYAAPAAGAFNMTVEIQAHPSSSWGALGTFSYNGNTGWQDVNYDLSAYAGQTVKFRVTASWVSGDFYVAWDNFKVGPAPTCPNTSDETVTAAFNDASISWTGGNADFYVVTSGSPAPDGNTTPDYTNETSPFSISGLTMGQAYDAYIRSNCDVDGVSDWRKVSFTALLKKEVEWTEGFATSTLPAGWTNDGFISNSVSSLVNGGADGYFIYRNLYSFTATTSFTTVYVGELGANDEFSFKYKAADYSSPYAAPTAGAFNMIVEVQAYPDNTWTQLNTMPFNGNTGWQKAYFDLSNYAGEVVRFRVTANWVSGDFNIGWDDFRVGEALPFCTGTPEGGTAASDLTSSPSGSSINYTVSGYTTGVEGLTRDWEYSTDNGDTWTGVGVSGDNVNLTVTGAHGVVFLVRYAVSCSASGETGYSNELTFTVDNSNCTPTFNQNTDYITNFSLENLNNPASGFSTGGYGDFRNLPPAELVEGYESTAYISSSAGTLGHGLAIWIDYNDNNLFEANERVGFLNNVGPNENVSISFTPFVGSAGLHRMRVVYQYAVNGDAIDPCVSAAYGEGEDYMVLIVSSEDCSGTPDAGSVTINPGTGGAGSSYNVSLTNYTIADGLSFVWQYKVNNGAWVTSNETGTSFTATATNNVGDTIEWKATVICNFTEDSADSATATFTVVDACTWTVHVWDDYWGDEVEWELRNAGGDVLLSGNDYGQTYDDTQSISAPGPVTFWITNDGFYGDNEPNYEVSNGDSVVFSGELIEYSASSIESDELFCPEVEEEANIWENGQWSLGVPVKVNSGRKLIFRSDFNSLAGAMSDGSGSGNTNKYGRIWGTSAEVEAGVNVVFNPEHALILDDELIVDSDNGASLTFKSGAVLSQRNKDAVNQGIVYMERDFTMAEGRVQYNLLASPVMDFNMQYIYAGEPMVFRYNENNDQFVDDGVGAYVAGKGFRVNEDGGSDAMKTFDLEEEIVTGIFYGVPANGNMNYPLTVKSNGINLTGNPYPSILNLDKVYSRNENLITGTFSFWDNRGFSGDANDANNHYATYNAVSGVGTAAPGPSGEGYFDRVPTNEASVGSGFFVQAVKKGKLTFTNGARLKTDSEEPEFFGRQDNNNRYWLTMTTPDNMQSMAAVVYFAAGNNGLGVEDSKSLNSTDALYTLVNDEQLVIQGKSSFVKSDVVPVGVKVATSGVHKIAVIKQEGVFGEGQNIYLRDKDSGAVHNLSAQPYSFTADAGEYNDRFEIIYNGFGLSSDALTQSGVIIEKADYNIQVTSTLEQIKNIEVYNLAGLPIYSKSSINAQQYSVPVSLMQNQIVVVKVETVSGKIVNKKFVNQQ